LPRQLVVVIIARTRVHSDLTACYVPDMTKEQVRAVLDRVMNWPPERQADVVQVIESMEEQGRSPVRLSDEQVAEVRKRLADPNPRFLTLDEVRESFVRRKP
jgi:hypothetical protein